MSFHVYITPQMVKSLKISFLMSQNGIHTVEMQIHIFLAYE